MKKPRSTRQDEDDVEPSGVAPWDKDKEERAQDDKADSCDEEQTVAKERTSI